MLKQKYQTPKTEIIVLDTPQLMLTVSGEKDSAGMGDDNVGNDTPDLGINRRGSWGNRWE